MSRNFNTSLKGKFLIATPKLLEANFSQGVILICEHNSEGSFGLIINKKSHLKAETHFGGTDNKEWIKQMDLFIGGPVHTNHILILYRANNDMPSSTPIFENIVLINNLTDFKPSDFYEEDRNNNIRLYLGCAGWEKDQLENEINAGAWKILSAHSNMIFADDPTKVWHDNLNRLGGTYSILAKMPNLKNLYKN